MIEALSHVFCCVCVEAVHLGGLGAMGDIDPAFEPQSLVSIKWGQCDVPPELFGDLAVAELIVSGLGSGVVWVGGPSEGLLRADVRIGDKVTVVCGRVEFGSLREKCSPTTQTDRIGKRFSEDSILELVKDCTVDGGE
jgi:hypothetical protein